MMDVYLNLYLTLLVNISHFHRIHEIFYLLLVALNNYYYSTPKRAGVCYELTITNLVSIKRKWNNCFIIYKLRRFHHRLYSAHSLVLCVVRRISIFDYSWYFNLILEITKDLYVSRAIIYLMFHSDKNDCLPMASQTSFLVNWKSSYY